jgi:hypothetical protein
VLIRKLPKKPKRTERFISPRHRNHIRQHACVRCGAEAPIECAHVRLGSMAGISRKPDDFRAVSLCGGPDGCHQLQHTVGEASFWQGRDVEALIAEFIRTSPVRREIEAHQRGDA